MSNETKKCPFCEEEINIDAQKCKHCGEWLNKELNKEAGNQKTFGKTLVFALFFGFLGVHRFHTGYKTIGFIQLGLSLTFFGMPISATWALVDTISICLNKYKDANNNPLTNFNKTWGSIVLVIAICGFLRYLGAVAEMYTDDNSQSSQKHQVNTSENKNTPRTTVSQSKPDIEVLEHHTCKTEYGNDAICGIIQNNTNRNYSYVQIEANFYDQEGIQVGNGFDNANDLEPHGKLKFEILFEGNNVASYKLKPITKF